MADQNPPTGAGSENPERANRPDREIRHDAFFDNTGLDPSQPLMGLVCYTGILGRSSQPGLWTLYLGLDMSEYLEIRDEDIISSQPLPPERSPFGSLGGSLVCVKKGATLNHVQTSTRQIQAGAAPASEFDLDVRLGAARQRSAGRGMLLPPTIGFDTCPTPECQGANTQDFNACVTQQTRAFTCETCGTCADTCTGTCGTQCGTCDTQCGTCRTCDTACGTCATACGTCQTECGTCGCGGTVGRQTCADTCATCQTCFGQTCETCITCDTCRGQTCDTCMGNTCDTCRGQTCETCFQTCDTCPGNTCQTCQCGRGGRGTNFCPPKIVNA